MFKVSLVLLRDLKTSLFTVPQVNDFTSKLLKNINKEEIKSTEIGKVISIKDGVAQIRGLKSVKAVKWYNLYRQIFLVWR